MCLVLFCWQHVSEGKEAPKICGVLETIRKVAINGHQPSQTLFLALHILWNVVTGSNCLEKHGNPQQEMFADLMTQDCPGTVSTQESVRGVLLSKLTASWVLGLQMCSNYLAPQKHNVLLPCLFQGGSKGLSRLKDLSGSTSKQTHASNVGLHCLRIHFSTSTSCVKFRSMGWLTCRIPPREQKEEEERTKQINKQYQVALVFYRALGGEGALSWYTPWKHAVYFACTHSLVFCGT